MFRPERRGRVAASVLVPVLALSGVVWAASLPAHAATPRVLDRGHLDLADVAVTYDGAQPTGLRIDLKDDSELHDSGSVRIDPGSAVVHLGEAARMEWPLEDTLFEYGQEIWLADQSGDMQGEVPWPGWNTERIARGVLAGERLDLRMELLGGPGDVVVFTMNDSAEVSELYLDSREGAGAVQGMPVGSHRHAGWVFTAPGEYRLATTAVATRASDGQRISSSVATYRFCVGDLSGCPSASASVPAPDPTPTTVATPTPTTVPQAPSGTRVIGAGHVDLASVLRGDRLTTVVRDSSQVGAVVDRSLGDVVFHVRPAARTAVPQRDAYAFLGKPGSPVWLLPQTQAAGLLWPGWSTEGVAREEAPDGVVWQLDRVRGLGGGAAPGRFALYDTDSFGLPRVLLDSGDVPSRFVIPAKAHAHGNWAFSAEGAYCLDLTRAATLTSGRQVRHTGTLLVAVGDTDVRRIDPGDCAEAAAPSGPIPTTPTGAHPAGSLGVGSGAGLGVAADGSGATDACTPSAGAGTVLAGGHVDVATRLIEGRAALTVKDGSGGTPTWREPAAVVVAVPDAARVAVPASGFGFLGTPGTPVWQIPQTQRPGIVWLGWNTQDLDPATVRGAVSWRLDEVSGPGEVSVYTLDAFGAAQVLLAAGRTLEVPLGTHAHGTWAFTRPGTYRLRMIQSFTLADGSRVTDSETLTVAVGAKGGACGSAGAGQQAASGGTLVPPAAAGGPAAGSEEGTGMPVRLVAGLLAGNLVLMLACVGGLFWFLRRQLAVLVARHSA